jgi:hypothetical protein
MTRQRRDQVLQLINQLLRDPIDFQNRGRGNELLSFYFNGSALDSLRPLLSHQHKSVRGTAMFVAAELGVEGRPLIDAIVPLTDDTEPHTAWDAMESVFLCATDTFADRFVFVVKQLENTSGPLRQLAMELISKAQVSQLHGALSRCEMLGESAPIHEKCLSILVDSRRDEVRDANEMLESDTELIRLYGAILARRLVTKHSQLLELAASNEHPEVKEFAVDQLETREWKDEMGPH